MDLFCPLRLWAVLVRREERQALLGRGCAMDDKERMSCSALSGCCCCAFRSHCFWWVRNSLGGVVWPYIGSSVPHWIYVTPFLTSWTRMSYNIETFFELLVNICIYLAWSPFVLFHITLFGHLWFCISPVDVFFYISTVYFCIDAIDTANIQYDFIHTIS